MEEHPMEAARLSSDDAVTRCYAEMASVLERYVPLIGPDHPDARLFGRALEVYRCRAPRGLRLL